MRGEAETEVSPIAAMKGKRHAVLGEAPGAAEDVEVPEANEEVGHVEGVAQRGLLLRSQK